MNRTLALAVVALFAVSGSAGGQQAPAAPPPSGHWVGSIEAGPGISVEVDLGRQGDLWRGTISIPAQGTKGLPLADLVVKNAQRRVRDQGCARRSPVQGRALAGRQDHRRDVQSRRRKRPAQPGVEGRSPVRSGPEECGGLESAARHLGRDARRPGQAAPPGAHARQRAGRRDRQTGEPGSEQLRDAGDDHRRRRIAPEASPSRW